MNNSTTSGITGPSERRSWASPHVTRFGAVEAITQAMMQAKDNPTLRDCFCDGPEYTGCLLASV